MSGRFELGLGFGMFWGGVGRAVGVIIIWAILDGGGGAAFWVF